MMSSFHLNKLRIFLDLNLAKKAIREIRQKEVGGKLPETKKHFASYCHWC